MNRSILDFNKRAPIGENLNDSRESYEAQEDQKNNYKERSKEKQDEAMSVLTPR